MLFEIIGAVICTIFAGFLGSGILGNLLNWPDAGAVCAIATMGAFILHACLTKNQAPSEDETTPKQEDPKES